MKQKYETPKMEVIQFSEEDVIMTSGSFATSATIGPTTSEFETTDVNGFLRWR